MQLISPLPRKTFIFVDKYACGDRSPKRSYDLGLARHEVYKRDNSWDQRINVERNRISNTQREKSFSNYIPPAPRKIQWNNESDISAPKRRHSPSPQRNANIYEHDKRSRFSHRDGEQNNRKFSRSPTMNYMQQQTQNRQSRSPRRNDDDYLGTKSRFQDSERYSSRYSPPFSSRQRQLRSPLRNEERPTGSNLAREIARNATRSSLSPVRNFSYMPTREINYQRSPERDDYRSDQPTSSSSLNTKERNATGLSPKYFRHSPSPLRDNYRSYTATSSGSQNSRAINPFRSSPSPSRDLNFKRERERNYRHRYSRSPPPPKKMPKKILRLLKFKELRKERRAILQESGVDVLAIYRAEREQKRIKKGLLPNKQEKKKQKPKIPRKVAKLQAFSKRTAYNKVMKNGMNKFLESKANREIFFMKPVKGHLKGSPKEYWTIWWSSLKYIESAIPNINPEDMDVKPVINFLLEPGTGAYAHRKRILLKMGVSTSTRFFDRISEEDYATWDMFRLMQYIKHLEDDKFQNNLSPFEVERAKMAITPWRQDKRKSALLHQALICMWHFPMRGYKHLEKEDRIRKIQNHIVLGNKAFHYMVAESVQILKVLVIN